MLQTSIFLFCFYPLTLLPTRRYYVFKIPIKCAKPQQQRLKIRKQNKSKQNQEPVENLETITLYEKKMQGWCDEKSGKAISALFW